MVLRTQRAHRPRLLPPLARCTEPRRHLDHRLESSRARGHLIGGFPCQDVSTVGKRAGLAPGTRSGLLAHVAAAIDALQPEW
ncbi:DNA cytosine methyltransferase [Brevibacterium casei]